ncbi:hypothetical protein ACFLXI_03595 [Chloroflexota bacterium]
MLKNTFFTIISFVLILVVTGCKGSAEPIRITVDPTFQEFYESLGGKPVLGPAISSIYEEGGKKLQFTAAALMMFDPDANESQRFSLVPLGNAMNVAEPPLAPTSPNGHEIYPGFLTQFRQLGGTRITGKPITGVKADPAHKRIIQYFENVGFYQLETDNQDTAHLLYYGVWKCAQACNFPPNQESIVIPPSAPGFGIAGAVDRIDPGLTGFPISEIYNTADGKEEQIFENVVICTDSHSPGGVALRPLPQLLGIQPDTPSPAGQEEGKFISVDGNQGFNVPYHFDEYIERNSGYDFIGTPINNYEQISEELFRQCFENICLEYDQDTIDGLQIQPMPLGRRFKQNYSNKASDDEKANSFDAVTLTVWERHPVINSEEIQEIFVMVQDSGTPLKGIDLVIEITMPDGSQQTQQFSPTGQDGQSRTEIGQINATNGTLIGYQVCLDNIPGVSDCVLDDYLIWGNP